MTDDWMTSTDQAGMVEAAAQALSFTPWHLAPEDLKRIIRRQAERVLTAALAGRTVIELPEPNTVDEDGVPAWSVFGNDWPDVSLITEAVFATATPEKPDDVEAYALALIAAAREARRMAEVADDPAE